MCVSGAFLEPGDGSQAALAIAHAEEDGHAEFGEPAGGLEADSLVGTSDEGGLFVEHARNIAAHRGHDIGRPWRLPRMHKPTPVYGR
jgi:hypothetical protein